MGRIINENTLVCIKNNKELLELFHVDFDRNDLINNKGLIELQKLAEGDYSWTHIRNTGYEIVNRLKKELPHYFHEEEVLVTPYQAYSREDTIGLETLFKKIPTKIENSDDVFFLYENDEDCTYDIDEMIEKLELTSIDYLYEKAILRAKKQGALAYSHRKHGWNVENFNLDQNFKIRVATNFGYGGSSYFHLTLVFDDIPIIPYTKIIYYPYVNASNLMHFTEDYGVSFNSFERCFGFVVQEVNDFRTVGKESFVHKHIIQSLEELTFLLEKILDCNLFYFVDLNKLDSYLDLNGRTIIYDYEHLLANVNRNAINEQALVQFMEVYEKINFYKISDDKMFKMYNELSNFVLCESTKLILNEGHNNDLYGYAIAMLLSKYSEQFESWRNLSDESYSTRIQSIVKKILNLEYNYKMLIYRKTGFELMSFRNERILLALQLTENISKLNELIDAKKYIQKVRRCVSIIIKQNQIYLEELESQIKSTKHEHVIELKKYENAKEEFEKSTLSKKYCYFEKFLELYSNVVKLCGYDDKEGKVLFKEDFDAQLEIFVIHIAHGEDIASIHPTDLFETDGYRSNDASTLWSVKILSDRYIASQKEIDKQALDLILIMVKSWNGFILDAANRKDFAETKSKLNEMLIENRNSSIKLAKIILNNADFASSFNVFLRSYRDNNALYSNLKPQYDEAVKPILEMKKNIDTLENKIKKIENYKANILNYNKKMEAGMNN